MKPINIPAIRGELGTLVYYTAILHLSKLQKEYVKSTMKYILRGLCKNNCKGHLPIIIKNI